MMTRYLSLLALTCTMVSPLIAEEEPQEGYLSSTNAAYDGSALKLSGHVVLDHGLGKMNAEEASLQRQEAGKDFPFSVIELKKEVLLTLKSSGQLLCDEAMLDFSSLKGSLSAPLKGLVSFHDSIDHKGKSKDSFSLQSPRVELTFLKLEAPTKSDYEIETVIAKDGVNIDYNKEFILKADRALYRKETSEMKGVVSAYPKDSASVCHLIHGADEIDAKAVDLDTLSSTLSLHKAQGHIATSLLMTEQKGHMSFSSDLIVWDDPHLTLKLHGHSEIIEPALGTIHTDKTLTVMQSSIDGQKVISHVETEGHSVLTYKDAGSGQSHKISSFGAMKIDRDTLSATLSSPSKGRTAEQVYYEEMKMGVYADSASIEFTQLSDKIEPLSFSLKGHVTLFSRGEGEPFRCAIADRMSYNPSTKTLILSAMPGQKVLFWDEQQAVRMSAQEVHLTQNPTSQQAVIQGVGNVKFTLSTEENDALKKFFPQYKPQP